MSPGASGPEPSLMGSSWRCPASPGCEPSHSSAGKPLLDPRQRGSWLYYPGSTTLTVRHL